MASEVKPEVRNYRVDVGHNTVLVRGSSPEEAIRLAKVKLSQELPRLWDVIQKMGPDRFKVTAVY